MKCSNCGSNIPDSAKFCGVCGVAILPAKPIESAKTVAFDPSADPEFQAAAAAFDKASTPEPDPKPSSEEPSKAKADEPLVVKAKSEAPPVVEVSTSKPVESSDSGDSASPQDEQNGANKKKGKFRETIWFMQADDPEMMSAIENEKLEDREATYQDPGGSLDERSREKFSLNISESKQLRAIEREAMGLDDVPDTSKSWFYASVAIGAIVLVAGIYFIFIK